MGEVRLGTSGWSYEEWVGPFYPSRESSKLSYYGQVFQTAEIDSTFYSYPKKGMVFGWLRYTPPDFVFTAKIPQVITHDKHLDARLVQEDLKRFCELMEPLQSNGKLACLLIQLPPSFRFNPEKLESFFETLREPYRYAVEFRHKSWIRDETWRLLTKFHVAYTVVDEPLLPPVMELTADFSYFRWHGRGKRPWYDYRYNKAELQPWIPKVKSASNQANVIYGFFNNHYHGYAVENCLQVLDMLGQSSAKQKSVLAGIMKFRKSAEEIGTPRITSYTGEQLSSAGVEDLLHSLMSETRIDRAKLILPEDIRVIQEQAQLVEANVRGYRIQVEMENRIIRHDCQDWQKGITEKRLCKHLGALLLSIRPDLAQEILVDTIRSREKWVFEDFAKA